MAKRGRKPKSKIEEQGEVLQDREQPKTQINTNHDIGSIRLSPSSLNLFVDCPRCFYLDKIMKIARPRGIFPSLPGGMDIVIKDYFDSYRSREDMPPEIKSKIEGVRLFNDMNQLKVWRSWRTTNLSYKDEEKDAELSGALDDCFLEDTINGVYHIPADYKTRGSELKYNPAEYYQLQLDCYTLMLESSGYITNDKAYLIYYIPVQVGDNGNVSFSVQPYLIKTNKDNAKETFRKAVEVLRSPEIPDPSSKCEQCQYFDKRSKSGY